MYENIRASNGFAFQESPVDSSLTARVVWPKRGKNPVRGKAFVADVGCREDPNDVGVRGNELLTGQDLCPTRGLMQSRTTVCCSGDGKRRFPS
jgi:hypothetical protein